MKKNYCNDIPGMVLYKLERQVMVMKSTSFKNLQIGERFGKGCKTLCKVAVIGVIGTTMLFPMTANAAVEPYAIVADQQYRGGANRQSIRNNDVSTIDNMFTNNVSLDKVSAAIELSDAINANVCFDVNYTNTNLSEVRNLQPTSLLSGLERARRNGTEWRYCNNLHDELAAIDAYTMFGCKTVSEDMKEAIGEKVATIMRSYGMSVTKTKVVIDWNEAYVLVSNSSSVVKVNLYGTFLDQVKGQILCLEDKYNTVTADMKGTGWRSENSFAYNGVNRHTGQSVWLSLGDDQRKAMLREGIDAVNTIKYGDCIAFDCNDYYAGHKLSSTERQTLRNMGYTSRQVNSNKEVTLSMDKVWVHTMPCNPGCYVPNVPNCPSDPHCGHPYNPWH